MFCPIRRGNVQLVEKLLGYGVDARATSACGAGFLAEDLCSEVDAPGIIQLLGQHGGDLFALNDRGFAPVHVAAEHGKTETLQVLIDQGASIECESDEGIRPLHMAAKCHYHGRAVKQLLELGAQLDSVDCGGEQPIHYAAKFDAHLDCVRTLLDAGADVNAVADGATPISFAVSWEESNKVRFLLDRGANVHWRFQNNSHLLALAVTSAEISEILISHGILESVNEELDWGLLHLSASFGDLVMLRALLDLGWDPLHKDETGMTPMDWAIKKSQLESVALLESYQRR